MTAERRRIRVTEANLRNATLSVTGLRDFFPAEAIGGPRRTNGQPKMGTGSESSRCLSPFSLDHGFDLILDGLGETVRTDIGSDGKNGKARAFLRCRGGTARFPSPGAAEF